MGFISGGGGGGSGEINTGSNIGVGGVGVYATKSGVDLQFKNINAGSSKITVTNDAGNNEIDIDVAEANLSLPNIGGTLTVAKGGTGATDAATARTNLGLVIGTNVQAYDAELAALAGLTSAADALPYFTGSGTAAVTTLTSTARTLLDDTTTSAMRTTLGLAIGTDVQAYDAELAAIAGLTSAADRLPYFTGLGTAALATFTAAGRALVDDADATAQRTTLGLGTMATVNSPVPVANGGTALTGLGTANQVLGVNNGATGLEYKTITAGTNVTVTHGAGTITIASSGGASGYATVQEEGSGLTQRATLNFIGSGITAADNAGSSRTDVTLHSTLNSIVDGTWTGSSAITTLGTIGTGTWNATAIGVSKGGTGLTATPTNGQIPIGNGTGFSLAAITAGTNITVTNGAGTITIAASGGGGSLSLYAENPSAPTAPSATGTNANAIGSASVASGTRAVAFANSRAAGADSFAAGIQDNTTSYGTNGTAQSGFAMGYVSKATGAYGKAFGEGAIASGTQTTAIGDNTQATQQSAGAWGSYCKSTAQYGMAFGRDSLARVEGQLAFSSGVFSNGAGNGASQCSLYTLRRQTTSASQTLELCLDNSSARITLQTGEAIVFDGLVIGKEADATGHVGAYKIEGVLKNVGGVYTLCTSTVTTLFEDDSTWGVALSASSGLKIDATGDATNNVRWTAWVRAANLMYA